MTSTDSTAITTTAACDTFRHFACRGVVLSLTEAHGSPCACPCHGSPIVRDLPETFAELVFLTPPCDQDLVLDEDEIEDILDREADRRLDQVLVDELFGAEL